VLLSSDVSPQATRPSARTSKATAVAIAGMRGDFIPCVLSPSDDASLSEGQEADQGESHQGQNDDGRELTRHL
jgi:hypothetical protein